jgi:hypothetical protein
MGKNGLRQNANLIHYSGYTEEEMSETVALMLDFLSKPLKYEAMYKKYSQRKFMKGAIFVKDWIESHKSSGLHPIKEHPMNAGTAEEDEPEYPSEEEFDE